MDQITSLAKIIHEARFSRHLTNELARSVLGFPVFRRRVGVGCSVFLRMVDFLIMGLTRDCLQISPTAR